VVELIVMCRPLKPDEWIDDLEWDALHTKKDVEEVFEMVREKEAKLRAEAIRKAALN
jgi:hypothetical protein